MIPILALAIDPYILTFSLITVVATVWLGFWSARKSKTASDFFVAGRSVSVGWNASAISGEYLSAASFMGVAGMVMSSGYDALWYPVCYACGYLFLLLFIAGPLRRFGAYTIPDFAEGRYDSPVFRKIAVVFVLFIGFFYTMPQMKGAGTTLAYIFPGLPYWAGVVLVGAVITLNVALGGMKGITLVQAFQYWAKMFAISVPIFVLMAVYGHYGKQLEVNSQESRAIKYPPMLLRDPDTPEDFRRKLSILEAFYEYARLTHQKALHSGSLGLDQLDQLLGGRLTAHHLLRAPLLPTNELEFTTPIGSLLPEEAFRSIKPPDVSMSLAPAGGSSSAFVRIGNPTPEEFARSLTEMFVRVPRSQRVFDLWKALNDHDVELLPVGKDYIIARVRDLKPRTASTTNRDPFKVQGSEFKVESSEMRKALPQKTPTELFLAPPEVFSMEYTLSMKYLDTKVAGVRVDIAQTATNFAGHVVIGTNAIGIPNAAASAIYRYETNRILRSEFDSSTMRKTLPQNAPADSTWLNPFGPLTTKASKQARIAAEPSVEALAQFREVNRWPVTHATNFYGFASKLNELKDKLRPPKPQRPPTGMNGRVQPEPLLVWYKDAVRSRVYIHENIPLKTWLTVSFNHSTNTTDAEIAALIEVQLSSNSIVMLHGKKSYWAVKAADAKKLQALIAPAVPVPISFKAQRAYALLYTYSLIIALVCGTAGLPHILVRFYTNPDGVAAKRTTMWVMILIGVFYLFPPVFGVLGRNLLPELYAGVGAKGTDKIVLELPRIVNRSAAVPSRSTPDGLNSPRNSQGASSTPTAAGEDSRAPKQSIPWGSILSGITCAGAFAAFMSTFSGLLVSMTGALAHDVYGRMLRPHSTSAQRLRAFRVCAVIVGAVAILLGMQVEPFQINFMVGQAFAIAAASYFPLLFMSVWWRSMTMKGAATGMLAGGLLALTGITLTSFSDLKWLPLNAFWAAHPLLRILCEQPAIWTVPLAITLMILVSKLTRKEIPSDVRMKMLVLHAPEKLGLKQEYIQEHQHGH